MSLTPLGARGQVGYGLGRTDALPLGKLVLDLSLSQANYSGGQYLDVSGYGNHGTPEVAPSFETDHNGVANGATTFDGVNQYITVADDESLDAPNDGLTILVWAKITVPFSSMQAFVSKWINATNQRQYLFQGLDFNSYFHISDPAYSNRVARKGFAFSSGWKHLVGQWNGEYEESLSINTFVDGSLENASLRVEGSFSGMTATSEPLEIGARGGGEDKFSGAISRVQIYRRGLTSDEIADLYSST